MPQPKKLAQNPLLNASSLAFLGDLQQLYPAFIFKPSSRFRFHPPNTIYYEINPNVPFQSFALQLLHELGHAMSGHYNYRLAIERLKLEVEAWQTAQKILELHPEWKTKYCLVFDQDFAELHLDTYRDWLHQKATCPKCGLTMLQNSDQNWLCPHCDLP